MEDVLFRYNIVLYNAERNIYILFIFNKRKFSFILSNKCTLCITNTVGEDSMLLVECFQCAELFIF